MKTILFLCSFIPMLSGCNSGIGLGIGTSIGNHGAVGTNVEIGNDTQVHGSITVGAGGYL